MKNGIVFTQICKDGKTETKIVGKSLVRDGSSMSISEYQQLKNYGLDRSGLNVASSFTSNFVSGDLHGIEN